MSKQIVGLLMMLLAVFAGIVSTILPYYLQEFNMIFILLAVILFMVSLFLIFDTRF
jgi:cell division protein FtsX